MGEINSYLKLLTLEVIKEVSNLNNFFFFNFPFHGDIDSINLDLLAIFQSLVFQYLVLSPLLAVINFAAVKRSRPILL